MCRVIKITLLFLVAILLMATPVLAYLYQAPITITETNGTAYNMLPWMVRVNNQFMADNGFMEADALDTRVQTLSGLNKPHLVTPIRTLSSTAVPADSQTNLYFVTGESDLASLDIIAGYDGYIRILDAAAIELGNDFEIEQEGYIDTSVGADKNLIYKEDAFRTYVSAAEEISSVVPDTVNPASTPGGTKACIYGDNANYNTARTQAVGTGLIANPSIGQRLGFEVYRGYVWFDTSPIPDGATITSATLHFRGSGDTSVTDFDIIIQSGMPARPADTLTTADYDMTFYSGNYGEMNTADYVIGDNPIELTAGGLAIINKTGLTKFCLRSGEDIDNSQPAGDEWVQGTTANTSLTVLFEAVTVTATGVSSGEHKVRVTADTTDLKIYIDDVEEDSSALGGASVPDNANDYLVGENNCIPYMETMTIDVASVEKLEYLPADMVTDTQFEGTADAGGSTVKIIDAALDQANDYWNGARLIIIETTDHNAPEDEIAIITDFLAATDELQFVALTAGVDAGDTYDVSFGTLEDETGSNDGRITWGHNPTGVAVSIGGMVSSGQPGIGVTIEDIPSSVLPEATVSDWFGDGTVGGDILTNPFRPFITMVSDNTDLTEILVWRLLGGAVLLFVVVAVAKELRGHLGITAIVTAAVMGGMVALDHNIFPLWLLVVAVMMLIAGLVSERTPSV